MFGLNEEDGPKAIAFADDLILYYPHVLIERVEVKIQEKFTQAKEFLKTWRLKINLNKCETILFRPRTSKRIVKTEKYGATSVSVRLRTATSRSPTKISYDTSVSTLMNARDL